MLDLAFLMDATGSMRAAIQGVHDYAINIARTFRIDRKLELQFACICYRDPVDSPRDIHQTHDFNPSVRALETFLKGVPASGGGDGPEDFVGAIQAALSLQMATERLPCSGVDC
jgi:hypothetical protein